MYEVIIVGSGVAGVAAALEFADQGLKPLVLDVGNSSPDKYPRVEGNLYDYRKKHDCFELMIDFKVCRIWKWKKLFPRS